MDSLSFLWACRGQGKRHQYRTRRERRTYRAESRRWRPRGGGEMKMEQRAATGSSALGSTRTTINPCCCGDKASGVFIKCVCVGGGRFWPALKTTSSWSQWTPGSNLLKRERRPGGAEEPPQQPSSPRPSWQLMSLISLMALVLLVFHTRVKQNVKAGPSETGRRPSIRPFVTPVNSLQTGIKARSFLRDLL